MPIGVSVENRGSKTKPMLCTKAAYGIVNESSSCWYPENQSSEKSENAAVWQCGSKARLWGYGAFCNGAQLSRLERWLYKPKVGGSSPLVPFACWAGVMRWRE